MKNQLDERLAAVENDQHELKKRLAYLEGLFEGLRIARTLIPPIPPTDPMPDPKKS